jgi:hypothetical protein
MKNMKELIEGIISIGAGVYTYDTLGRTGYLSSHMLNEIMSTSDVLDGYEIETAYPPFITATKNFGNGYAQHMQLWDVGQSK